MEKPEDNVSETKFRQDSVWKRNINNALEMASQKLAETSLVVQDKIDKMEKMETICLLKNEEYLTSN